MGCTDRFLCHLRFCCCIDIRFSIAARNASISQLHHIHHHRDVPCELRADWLPNCQPTPTKYLAPPLCNLLCDASSWRHVSEARQNTILTDVRSSWKSVSGSTLRGSTLILQSTPLAQSYEDESFPSISCRYTISRRMIGYCR